jgi:hypothetical protein
LLNASTTGDITPKLLTLSGTTVANKIYDGSTKATITATGSLSGFVGNETLLLSGVSGTFATAAAGNNLAVTLQANLQDGSNGGLASNYSVGTSTTFANITPANSAIIRPPVIPTNSSSSSSGGSGKGAVSSANPYLALPMEPASAERCTQNNLEGCQCEVQGGDGDVAICYEPQKTAETKSKTKPRRS